ncbi:MAG TPA: haloalkane dehalogenase [Acidimicrobiales bacterium]|nr:haloalkane dehalogenase [Acidimicrobiales bacterium]
MNFLRTPDDRFENLTDWPFAPNYVELRDGLRAHYVDEGQRGGAPVLLLHGEPSWSYLYRKMIPPIVAAGHRCIAPDLIGFGRSDKPVSGEDYTYQRLVDWTAEVVFDHLDLSGMTLFGQDWGGLVGLRLVAAAPERFARVVLSNTGLPTGDVPPNDAFMQWQRFSQEAPNFPIGKIISGGCSSPMPADVIAAYDAPFPDDSFKAGARRLPSLVPTSRVDPAHEANTHAWEVLRHFEKPFLCAFGDSDPVTRGGHKVFVSQVPGAAGLEHPRIAGGGHFIQEDKGEELAQLIVDFMATR